jgi:hypothetical protein
MGTLAAGPSRCCKFGEHVLCMAERQAEELHWVTSRADLGEDEEGGRTATEDELP